MLKLSQDTAIYVASERVDFRKAINGLAALVLEHFEKVPQDGSVYVFYNGDYTRVKCFWDKNGFVLYHKRLEQGRFKLKGKREGALSISHEAGISLTRGTLSNWMIKAADLLTPLVKLMEDDIQSNDIAYADETTLQVLKEKGKSPTQKSYMWLFIGGSASKRAFVYQYHPSRSHRIPANFFADFKGYLHADCYQAYVALGAQETIQHAACCAHARRYFVDVAKTTKKQGLAHQAIVLIGKLYHLEATLKEQKAGADAIFAARAQTAQPILHELKELLDQASLKILPKSPIGNAVFYALNHWQSLKTYLLDGRLDIDNNLAERSIKPFVIGRKNWLFHGNDIGARAGAILFSLIETCKHHQVDVFSWLKYTLAHVQHAHTVEQLQALLPYNIDCLLLEHMRTLPDLILHS